MSNISNYLHFFWNINILKDRYDINHTSKSRSSLFLSFELYIDVKKLEGGWVVDYNVSSGPFLSFDIVIGDGPGPELDNDSKNFG